MPLSAKILALLFAGVFFSIPLFMVDIANRRANRDIQTRGLLGEAEILSYTKRKLLYVQYKFTPKGHQAPLVCTKQISGWGFNKSPVGSVVRVWYLENTPSISVLEPYLASQIAS